MSDEVIRELAKIQDELDNNTSKYVEDDFNLKLAHHKRVSEILERRDKMISESFSREELDAFYFKIFTNFEPLRELFPLKEDQTVDSSIMKSIKAEYLDDFRMRVVLELFENEYVENQTLEKTMYLLKSEPDSTKIVWKNEKGNCPLFDFFENDDDDFEIFDILYELYVDMLFLADMESE